MPTEDKDKNKVTKNDRGAKPKGPPPPPPPVIQVASPKQSLISNIYNAVDEDDDADIPKTGFDFLDNW